MKKLIILALILTSCKSINPISTNTIDFAETSGKIKVTIKGDEWQKIESSGMANLLMKDDNAIEQAMNVAVLRAKANLIEFLESEVKSSKSSEVITNSLIKESINKEIASDIASKVNERIYTESKGIIKGAYVSERKVSNDQKSVMVTIVVDKNIIKALKK